MYARALVDHANQRPGQEHQLATLFAGPRLAAQADHAIDAPFSRLGRVGFDPRVAWRLRRLVERIGPDVVVTHGGDSLKYALPARRGRCLVVGYAIGIMLPAALQGRTRSLYAALYARADLMLAVSTSVAEQLESVFALPLGSVPVVPNGRDPAVFAGRRPAAAGAPRLVFVGHLIPTKRPEAFVELVAQLRSRGCELDAVMVGDGPLEAQLRPAAEAAGVTMLGRREDVPDLLLGASICVSTSMAEGMPGVLIEAGMAGLPVVASDAPGVRDVVLDGQTGRVLAVDDLAGLADATEELVRDAELRERLGRGARARCVELFSLEASTEAFLSALETLAARPADGRTSA